MLTDPDKFPPAGGIDLRDQDHPMFPKEMPFKIFLKPLVQKIIEKNLWIELIAVILAITLGLGELLGRQLSSGFYFAFGSLITVLLWRFINIENETHQGKVKPTVELEEAEDKK